MKLVMSLLALTTLVQAASITLNIKNLRNENGSIRIAIWDQAQGFPGDYTTSIEQVSIPATKDATYTLENVKAARYAIAVFHDANNDEDLNQNRLGIPKEGFGFSNNPRIIFGPPNFRKCNFRVTEGQNVTKNIFLKHL